MKFVSVLGGAEPASFSEAVLNGWAPDGGMYWPAAVEPVSPRTLSAWESLSYPRLCEEVLKRFIAADDPDVTPLDLAGIVSAAFSSFGDAEVVSLRPLSDELHVAELWHGPTLAFKDLGMSVLGRTLSHLLRRRRQRLTLLVGTSGDTGSSAMEAVRGLEGIEILVLYPLQGCSSISPVQELQMTYVARAASNVHLIGVEGSSDDLDVPLERAFRDAAFKRAHRLGSVNSVNVVRLLVQVVHYFYAYLRLPEGDLRPPEGSSERRARVAVPCGAGGHLAAGLLAQQMGLPITLLAATNANDALHRLLATGELRAHGTVSQTASPSMDIQVPYNVWRLLFVASGGDAAAVRGWQADFGAGGLTLPPRVREWLRVRVASAAVDDALTLRTMLETHQRCGYLLDPHTAVGVAAAQIAAEEESCAARVPTLCLGCAHPIKFLPTVAAAFGCSAPRALALASGPAGHRCVEAVGQLAQQAKQGYPAAGWVPPGCCAVLRKGEAWQAEWTAAVRAKVEELSAAAAALRSRL